MAKRLPGPTAVGLLSTKIQSGTNRVEVEELVRNQNSRLFYERFTDFDEAALVAPWTTRIVGTTPTVTKTANAVCGIWRAITDVTSEAETAGVDFGDSLMLNNPTAASSTPNQVQRPMFEAYLSIPTALTTNQTMVIGLATAFNATLTSIAQYAWFRLNANMNVLLEGKDGTTTTTGQVPTPGTTTLVAGTKYLFSIFLDYAGATFFLDDTLLGNIPMAALTTSIKLQPAIYVQKSTGVTQPAFDIDWANAVGWRF